MKDGLRKHCHGSGLIALIAVALLSSTAAIPIHADTTVVGPPHDGLTEISVPEPELSSLEPVVADQIAQANTALKSLLAGEASTQEKARGYGEMGKIFHAYELYGPAEACYLNAARLDREAFEWSYYLGNLYSRSGDLDSSEKWFSRALALAPDSSLTLVRLGELHLAEAQATQAKSRFLEAFYLQPGATAILARLGETALAEKRYELAVKYLSLALTAQPQATRLNYLLGMAYRGQGDPEKSRSHLAQSGPVGVQPPDPYLDELKDLVQGERLHLLRGKLAYSAGQYAQAANAFKEAVQAKPDSARAHTDYGTALARLERRPEAIAQYREALRLAPANTTARFNLAQLLLPTNPADSETLFHALANESPQDPEIQLGLARAFRQTGKTDSALSGFQNTIRLDPGMVDGWIEGAQLLVDLERNQEAVNVLEKAHEQLPQSGRIAHSLARLLAGAPDPSVRNGRRALELAKVVYDALPTPGHAETLAMAHAQIDNCEQAASWQEIALSMLAKTATGDSELAQIMADRLQGYRSGSLCARAEGNHASSANQ